MTTSIASPGDFDADSSSALSQAGLPATQSDQSEGCDSALGKEQHIPSPTTQLGSRPTSRATKVKALARALDVSYRTASRVLVEHLTK